MVAPLNIGTGISIGGGIKVGNLNIYQGMTTTPPVQNVEGPPGRPLDSFLLEAGAR